MGNKEFSGNKDAMDYGIVAKEFSVPVRLLLSKQRCDVNQIRCEY